MSVDLVTGDAGHIGSHALLAPAGAGDDAWRWHERHPEGYA